MMDGMVIFGSNGKSFETMRVLSTQDTQGRVEAPAGSDFLRADFSRSGPDLLIHTPDGNAFLVPAYFMAETPPALVTHDGAVLSAKLLTALAGPLAPGMVAQAAAQQGGVLGASIGQVSDASGQVTVTHPDGSKDTLTTGGSVFQGDVLETGAGANVSIVFLDDTVFSLDESGRMVIDEMVYDPGTQTGAFSTQVVQGVFSFVSGQVAKTSPDGMVVTTPTSTVGIRGSTVLGQAGPEGLANSFTLMSDVDGNVGELTLTNGGGTVVLNQPGASTTVFSFNTPPAPPVFLSPVQIQQNYGAALTKLVQVVAQKATVDATRAQEKAQEVEQEAQQAQAEAQQAEEGAQQADAEAQQADAEAAQAEAEAAAAQAEAEAAKAEAAQANNPEAAAKAEAAEAKAAAAVAKAAETKAAAEAKIAAAQQVKAVAAEKAQLAAAKGAEAIKAQAEVQKAVQFTTLAKTAMTTQVQAFDQVAKAGLLPPGMAEKAATIVDQATKIATDLGAKFAGDTEGQIVSDIAAKVAADAASKAMAQMFNAVDPLTGLTNPFGITTPFTPTADQLFDQTVNLFNYFDPTSLYNVFATFDPYDAVSFLNDDNDTPLTTAFDETLIAGPEGGLLSGGAGDTNYYFQWRDETDTRWISGDYIVADAGGVNQISLDNLDNITVKVTMSTDTSGLVKLFEGLEVDEVNDAPMATLDFSSIDQFMLSDVSVASFATIDFATTQDRAGDVMVLSSLDAGETGYVIAGTDGDDMFYINQAFAGAIIFGKGNNGEGDGDVFYFETTDAKDVIVVGGADNTYDGINDVITDNYDSDEDGIADSFLNVFDYTNIGYSPGQDGIVAQFGKLLPIPVPDDVSVADYTTHTDNVDDNDLFNHELWDVGVFYASQGDDRLYLINGSYHHVEGGAGNDTITSYQPGHFNYLYGGVGDDTITVNASALEYNRVINGQVYIAGSDNIGDDTQDVGGDSLTIEATYGSAYNLTDPNGSYDVVMDFETVTFDAASAIGAVTVYSTLGQVTFSGSSFDDTFHIEANQNTITGGSGADIYKYVSASGNADLIQDFTTGIDKFEFGSGAFGNLSVDALSVDNFFSDSGTQGDGNDYFVFDTDTRILYYDSDVMYAGGETAIANLSGNNGTVVLADISIYDDSGSIF